MGWLPDVIGIIGVVLLLVAYYLLQISKLLPSDVRYLQINIIGSIFILCSLCFNWNLSAFMIEIIWLLVSIWGLWRTLRKQRALMPILPAK